MDLGVHLSNFTYPDGPPALADDLARIAKAAEDVGVSSLSVMDHVWQIGVHGPPELDMLEAYTTLGFLAAHTERDRAAGLGDGGRLPRARAARQVRVDAGRAVRRAGPGSASARRGTRRSRAAWGCRSRRPRSASSGSRRRCRSSCRCAATTSRPYEGKHYQLGRTLNVPQTLQRPHPPILIGGGGEKKTLRLVAQYAQACNLFASPDARAQARRAARALRRRRPRLRRDREDRHDAARPRAPTARTSTRLLERMRGFAELGITHVHGTVKDVVAPRTLELIGERLVPEMAKL